MYVIYKVFLNERASDDQFPKLKRDFKRETVESDCENPHLSLVKWLQLPYEQGVCYSVGKIK